ncbi:MAG: putative lipid II flippase FtsW, partial [Actinomycetota bacterium]|nr:putative lipid II flippase FtsW [Actinomycetota bacterium]
MTARTAVASRGGDRRGPTSRAILAAIVAVLCLIGLVMVLSASSVLALREYGTSWLFFGRQVLWLLLGAAALVVTSRVDYHRWGRLGLPMLVASLVLLALVLVPGVGITVSGSTRWLGTSSWRIQPSELAKLAVLVFAADYLARVSQGPIDRLAVRVVLGVFATVGLFVMRQPDMGTTLVLGCIVLALLFVAGTPLRAMAALGAGALAVTLVVGLAAPYRRARMVSFLNPWADAGNTGYQVVQSLVGLGTGRWSGVGLGASRAKWGFLPNAHTDFIFAIIGEELGLVGTLFVLALFMGFAVLGVRTALRAPDRFGTLLAAGITAWVVGQAMINIGAVTGVVPVTGVPLPFVSFGGSSLVILLAAVGMLLNVAAQERGRSSAGGPGGGVVAARPPAPAPA